jgi:hypothetical protein
MTTTTYRGRLANISASFLQQLKAAYPDSDVEIQLHAPDAAELDEEEFWYIIGLLDWNRGKNNAAILAPAVEYLSRRGVASIFRFDDILAEKLFQLDMQRFAEALGEHAYRDGEPFSVDNFLYARCCVVANGRSFFEKVLQDPTAMPKSFTFEPLLYLARNAYRLKTELNDYDHLPAISYETFSNPAGWPETLTDKLLK